MKISNIRVHRVNIPLETAYRWSTGCYFGASKAVLEVETDEGIVGLGEVPVELGSIVEKRSRSAPDRRRSARHR